MAHLVMAYRVMAYIVMAYTVMAHRRGSFYGGSVAAAQGRAIQAVEQQQKDITKHMGEVPSPAATPPRRPPPCYTSMSEGTRLAGQVGFDACKDEIGRQAMRATPSVTPSLGRSKVRVCVD